MTEMDRPAPAANADGAVDSSTYGYTSPLAKGLNDAAVAQQRIAGIGATYVLGTVQLDANYTDVLSNYADASGLRLENGELGVSKRLIAALLIGAAYVYTWGNYSNSVKPHYPQINVGPDYALSAKTDLFAAGIFQRAGGGAQYAEIDSLSPSSSHSQTALETGIRRVQPRGLREATTGSGTAATRPTRATLHLQNDVALAAQANVAVITTPSAALF